MDKSSTLIQQNKVPIKTNLLVDIKMNTACDYHRIVIPFSHNKMVASKPTLVYNRVFSYGIEKVKQYKNQGYKIVIDLDDYWHLNPEHYLYDHFHHHSKEIIEGIKLADMVIVTTDILAMKVRPHNKKVVVIRNALPFDSGQFIKSKNHQSNTPVVWAGGSSHYDDLKLISRGFTQKDITLAGYNENSLEWGKIKDILPRSNYVENVNINNYMKVYDGHKLAIAPLVDNFFNNCKSNLKVLEAGCKGIPIICSPVLPYKNDIDKNVVLYADTSTDWHMLTRKLLKDKIMLKEKGEELAEHVRMHYDLEDANMLRQQVLTSF